MKHRHRRCVFARNLLCTRHRRGNPGMHQQPTDFEAYLERYPAGTFAALARSRLESSRKSDASNPQQQAVELTYWESVKDSDNPARRFPRASSRNLRASVSRSYATSGRRVGHPHRALKAMWPFRRATIVGMRVLVEPVIGTICNGTQARTRRISDDSISLTRNRRCGSHRRNREVIIASSSKSSSG